MKFRKLYIKNFMRFQGEQSIEFSCLPDKNVTVVLGDNTVGKTTLAQAIRWVLYGDLIATQYEGTKDVCILNTDVLSGMTANDYEEVVVELQIEADVNNELKEYRIVRKANFVRKFPQVKAIQRSEYLKMYVKDPVSGKEIPYDNTGSDAGKVDELISEFLPKDLSSYFLFDGERWSNQSNAKNDIKESIYTLVGISPIRQMKEHLGEYGTNGRSAVIKTLKSKKSGNGNEYEVLTKEVERLYSNIDNQKKIIIDATQNADFYKKKAEEIQAILDENPNVEADQKECKQLEKSINAARIRLSGFQKDVVTRFSDAHKYFAAPLMQDVIDMLDGVELEGVDLPGVTDKTINTILNNHRCLCGHEVHEGSFEEKELLKLKRLVPPAVIGTIVGNFKDRLSQWVSNSADLYDEIKEKADAFQADYYQIEDMEEELRLKQKKIDRKINFASERSKMNSFKSQENSERSKVASAEGRILTLESSIKTKEEQIAGLESKNKANAKLDRYIAYAEALYKSASDIYDRKEKAVLGDLNAIIERNFKEMFNEQEKFAKLDDNYDLHLYYRSLRDGVNINVEATGLSEGEKIARNFAFIVSVLELANISKDEGEDAQRMPLVLDGPFSKLSDVNTSKVAGVLPRVANQVIIFMLDKDWEPSGLERYTDEKYKYRVVKSIDENSSSVEREVR